MPAVPARAGITARKKATQRPRNTPLPPPRGGEPPGAPRPRGPLLPNPPRHTPRAPPHPPSAPPPAPRAPLLHKPQLQHPRADHTADLVADAVAEDRGGDDHDEHPGQRDVTEPGGHPGEDRHRLPRDHEPHEQRVLGEDDEAD